MMYKKNSADLSVDDINYCHFDKKDKKAALSQREPRDAAVNFDTYRILQQSDNGAFMYAKHGNRRLEVIQGHALWD